MPAMTFRELRETLRADFARDEFPWDRVTLVIFRFGQWAGSARARRRPAFLLWRIVDTLYLRLLIGAELPWSVKCGPGLILRHAGQGVIVNHHAVIGRNAHIFHRVTIGVGSFGGPPVLGDDVYIGAGASILGEISVGDGAAIGAGAVVVKDVAPGVSVVGVPARPVGSSAPPGVAG